MATVNIFSVNMGAVAVKPAYVTEEEIKQLKQSALSASSQLTNPVPQLPHQDQATCLPTQTPKHQPIPPHTSDAVPFTGTDDGNVHSAHSLPYFSFDE
ncbi:hypothetical protein DSO57_1034482 [Entomophthora muscae]|uniref:Uncharacterized protein n=1 Tax=Entomophthora muscae TaxID=34485 RepID=A0ACC2RQS9_9FUNG|nr:hypothetical protein DSO57_1034482 [Entomophthora muscae]